VRAARHGVVRRGPRAGGGYVSACTLLAAGIIVGWSWPAAAAGGGGARIDKPVVVTVVGADCGSNDKGSVYAFFPNHGVTKSGGHNLGFNIGPIQGVDLPHSAPYTGPGTYTGAQIAGWRVPSDPTSMFTGRGTIVVHADGQTGTFATDDGKVSGTWDCGVPLR
jgi:hypothetical protein